MRLMRNVARRMSWAVAWILLLVPAVLPAQASAPVETPEPSAAGRHMLWRVTAPDGGSGYLLGSIHLARSDLFPLPDVYDEAFDEAELVAFEIDLDKILSMSFAMVRRGFYWDGRTLEEVVTPETWELLRERARDGDLDLTLLRRAKPWLVSLLLSVTQLQEGGYDGAFGIDQALFQRAKRADKERRFLETADEQFLFFDELSPEAQDALLRSALEETDDGTREIDALTEAWKEGDTETLDALIRETGEDVPGLVERLVVERNRNWVPRIEGWLTEGEPFLVVVGAGHLVGDDSVVDLLRKRGYRVERM